MDFGAAATPEGVIFGVFLTLYGLFRVVVESYREPDQQLGLIGGLISMGQILSVPMILAGVGILIRALRWHRPIDESGPIRNTRGCVRCS